MCRCVVLSAVIVGGCRLSSAEDPAFDLGGDFVVGGEGGVEGLVEGVVGVGVFEPVGCDVGVVLVGAALVLRVAFGVERGISLCDDV